MDILSEIFDEETGKHNWDKIAEITGTVDQPEESQKKTEYKSFVEHKGVIYEQVVNEKGATFAFWDGNKIEYANTIETQASNIMPREGKEITAGFVKFPSGATEYMSVLSLIDEIISFIHTYVDLPKDREELCAWYVLASYLYDTITVFPFLRFQGAWGSGKSRALQIIGELCYKPVNMGGALTPAPIYRVVEKYGGTLIIDEANWAGTSESAEITKILNCGFESAQPIVRCQYNDPDTLLFFPVFCPKVVATRYGFKDPALESRCLTVIMEETEREDIPDILTLNVRKEQNELRNKLLMFRLRNWKSVQGDRIDVPIKNRRLRQAITPIGLLLEDYPGALKRFQSNMVSYSSELKDKESISLEGNVANALIQLIDEGRKNITPSDILIRIQELNCNVEDSLLSPIKIGVVLSNWKFKVQQRKVNGKNRRVIAIDSKQINKLRNKFVLETEETTQHMDQGNDGNDSNGGNDSSKVLPLTLKELPINSGATDDDTF